MTDEVEDALEAEVESGEAEAEVEETKSEEVESPPESSTEKKESKGVQKRIDELTRNWRETERDRDYWRQVALEKNSQPEPKIEEPEKKTLEDFDFDEAKYQAYVKAEIIREAKAEALKEIRQERTKETQLEKHSSFRTKLTEFSKTVDDFEEVVGNPDLPFTQDFLDIVAETDEGPAIVYYLGKNPDLAYKLADLSPIGLAREIGRIEAKLQSNQKGESVTKAPPPPPKLEGVSNVVTKDPDKMTTKEWLKWREKQLAKQ